jgi:hypothetical protein
VEATSSTASCQPWKTSDSKSASQQLQKRKQLHSSRPTSLDHTDRTSRTTSRTKIRPRLRTAREAAPSPLPTRHTRRPRPTRRNDGVTRRADSCTPDSNYMRHRVRRNWQAWKDIGVSGKVLR